MESISPSNWDQRNIRAMMKENVLNSFYLSPLIESELMKELRTFSFQERIWVRRKEWKGSVLPLMRVGRNLIRSFWWAKESKIRLAPPSAQMRTLAASQKDRKCSGRGVLATTTDSTSSFFTAFFPSECTEEGAKYFKTSHTRLFSSTNQIN